MNRPCQNCGCAKLEFLFDAPAFDNASSDSPSRYDLARCQQCNIISTLGVTPDILSDAYSTDYYGSSTDKFIWIIEKILSYSTIARARRFVNFWRAGRNDNTAPYVVDIGCGRGQLLRAFQTLDAKVLGFERQEYPIDESLNGRIRAGSITEPQYADIKFDIVVLWHVLEHIQQSGEYLDAVVSHLNPGGLVVIAVPNFASLQRKLFKQHWFHLDLPRHLVHFEDKWLHKRMEDTGLSVVMENHNDLVQNGYGFIQSLLNAINPARPNQFYRLLKHGGRIQRVFGLSFMINCLLSVLFLPLAIIESAISAVFRKGATIQMVFKLEAPNDQQ